MPAAAAASPKLLDRIAGTAAAVLAASNAVEFKQLLHWMVGARDRVESPLVAQPLEHIVRPRR